LLLKRRDTNKYIKTEDLPKSSQRKVMGKKAKDRAFTTEYTDKTADYKSN
jgi:hypothetical protein